MDMGIISARRGQHVVVVRGVGYLPAGNVGSVNQAVDERGGGVLENLLDATGKPVYRWRQAAEKHRIFHLGTPGLFEGKKGKKRPGCVAVISTADTPQTGAP